MLRKFGVALVAFLVVVVGLVAAEIKGKVKSVDAEKGVLTVTVATSVGDKDQEFKVGDDAKVVNAKGKEIKDRLKDSHFKAGVEVTVTTDKKDGKDVVTEVKLGDKKKDK